MGCLVLMATCRPLLLVPAPPPPFSRRPPQIDMAFLRVLDINIDGATQDGDVSRVNFFTHLRTRAVEEIEKRAPAADGLISRALRATDAGIRGRILEEFLLPKSVVLLPSGQELKLDKPAPPKVTIQEFADALSDVVDRLRSIDADPELMEATVADLRALAKEVRLLLLANFDEEKVRWYERRLATVFAAPAAPAPQGEVAA